MVYEVDFLIVIVSYPRLLFLLLRDVLLSNLVHFYKHKKICHRSQSAYIKPKKIEIKHTTIASSGMLINSANETQIPSHWNRAIHVRNLTSFQYQTNTNSI